MGERENVQCSDYWRVRQVDIEKVIDDEKAHGVMKERECEGEKASVTQTKWVSERRWGIRKKASDF